MRQLHMESLRRRIDDEGINLRPPPPEVIEGEYPVGCVLYNGELRGDFGLREDEWLQHVAIVGRSGSGKTNTVYMLIANLLQKRIPFLITDWKRNYRPIISPNSEFPVLVYTVGNPLVPFHFNPLIPPEGTEPTAWLKKLIEILARATFVGEGVMYLLQQGIDKLYTESGVYSGNVVRYPTMKDLTDVMGKMNVSGRAANWMASTQRALSALSFGAMGSVLNTQSNTGLADLLDKPVILELDALTSTDKCFFIESLLLWIHHYRLNRNEQREKFRHAIIIEEAHHILKKKEASAQESVTEMLLREIRELGESITLVDQHPSQISLQALGNTYCTFTMNLKSREDVNAASGYLMFDGEERKCLNRLEVGQAIVKMQGRWTKPFLIIVPHIKQKQQVVSDEDLQEYMRPYSTDSVEEEPLQGNSMEISLESLPDSKEDEIPLDDMKKAFLEDIQENPLSGVVQRYKRLGLSRRKGNVVKEDLQSRGIIAPVEILTHKGKVVLLEIKKFNHYNPIQLQNHYRNPGIVHEYWRSKIAEFYQQQGYSIISEHQLESGDYVDLIANKGNETIAIEIETGKSDIVKNVQKNLDAGYEKIVILGVDIESTHRIHTKLGELHRQYSNRIIISNCADAIRT